MKVITIFFLVVQSVYKATVIGNWIWQDISRLYAIFQNTKMIKFTKRQAVCSSWEKTSAGISAFAQANWY